MDEEEAAGGVREERFRAALIRTLTVDGILLTTTSTPLCYYRLY